MQITGLLHESKIFIEVGTAGGNTFDTIHPTEHLEGGRCIVFLKKKHKPNKQQNDCYTKEDQVTRVPL